MYGIDENRQALVNNGDEQRHNHLPLFGEYTQTVINKLIIVLIYVISFFFKYFKRKQIYFELYI